MALVVNDRVKETSTTTGTGTLSLAGAVSGFQTFVAGIANSNTTFYCIVNDSGTEFEIGIGTVTDASPDTLSRDTILESSNSDSAVNFSSGTKTVFCTLPASKAVFEDASGNVTMPADLSVGDDLTVLGGVIDFKSNSGSPASLKMYCESSNAHFQTLQPQPHSASAANTLRLPNSGDSGTQDLVAVDITQTLTNKTLTTPTINGATIGSANLATASDGDINIAPDGTGKVVIRGNDNQGKIVLNCEANTHGQTIIAAPHSESANNVLTLPSTGGDARLVSTASTATLTNKSIDSDNNTITNIVNADIKASAGIVDTKLATISTAGKVDIGALEIDGATEMGAALVDADLLIVDDGADGTEKSMLASRIPTYVFSKVSGDVTIASNGAASIGSGVIVNADINASAAIADSKLDTISTADKVSAAAIQVDGATDGTGITIADSDKLIVDDAGATKYVEASQLKTYASGDSASAGFAVAMAIAL